MKNLIHLIIVVCFALFTTNDMNSANAGRHTIRFVEKVNSYNHLLGNNRLQAKSNRVSSTRGNLVLIYDDALPDSVKIALDVAKEIWESKIPNRQPVYIAVSFEPTDMDVAMFAEISYIENPQGSYPSSLAAHILDSEMGSIDSPDGYIILNSNINWNCNFSDNSNVGHNITTMALRGFALSFGFGSGINQEGNSLVYNFVGPTVFDKILKRNSTGAFLTSYASGSREFKDFITSDDVCATTSNGNYDVYAPIEYEPYRSLIYLKGNNSLMSNSLGMGNSFLRIDNATIDILNEIGWNIPKSGFDINCSDISSDGIGSSYKKHTFTLNNGSTPVSNLEWTFKLKKANGEFVVVSTGYGNSFTIDEIANSDGYFVNRNGDLSGTIECSYSINGNNQTANPFALSLELKPVILSVEKDFQYNSDYSFNALFNVNYTGADYITVEVEEEFDPAVRAYQINEPFFAHIKTGKISTLYSSWITFIVSNNYGRTTETLYIEPNYSRGYDENTSAIEYELNDIKYDYTVYSKDDGTLDCVGNLSFSLPIPEGLSHIILAKTQPHYQNENRIFFSVKRIIPFDSSQTSIFFQQEGIYWGTFFRIEYYMENGERLYSPIYNTNSYISMTDLDLLNGSVSVLDISQDDSEFSYDPMMHTLRVSENDQIEIYDVVGRMLYYGTGTQHISLYQYQGKCVIVRCISNNGVFTKKLMI